MENNYYNQPTIKQLQKICHEIALEKCFWAEIHMCPDCLGSGYQPEDDTINEEIVDGFACPKCNGKGNIPARNDGEAIALIHSELSEALEALRKENYGNLAEELADAVIRILDYCGGNDIDLESAILKKIEKNKERKYKYGKEF